MANTTWNPSDKSSLITLSGGNLIGTANSAGTSGAVRGIAALANVKLYFEITLTNFGGGNVFPGIATSAASLSTAPGGASTASVASGSGLISINGTSSGIALSAFTAGQIACFAVDLIGQLFWVRKTATGNWNNNSSNNPATGVGGISISSLFSANSAYAYSAFQAVSTAGTFTANFGDSAFSGAVPSGYIGGYPTQAPSSAARVMVLA